MTGPDSGSILVTGRVRNRCLISSFVKEVTILDQIIKLTMANIFCIQLVKYLRGTRNIFARCEIVQEENAMHFYVRVIKMYRCLFVLSDGA